MPPSFQMEPQITSRRAGPTWGFGIFSDSDAIFVSGGSPVAKKHAKLQKHITKQHKIEKLEETPYEIIKYSLLDAS